MKITNVIDIIAADSVLSISFWVFGLLPVVLFVGVLISHLNQGRQHKLIIQSSKTFFLLNRGCQHIQEIVEWPVEEGDIDVWGTRLTYVMSYINSSVRAGLIVGTDGCSIPIYPFLRNEVNNRDHCASLVCDRVIKQAGLSDLRDTKVLAWIISVVHTFASIRMEESSMICPFSDEDKCRTLVERYASRLAGLITDCPSKIRGYDGCELNPEQQDCPQQQPA